MLARRARAPRGRAGRDGGRRLPARRGGRDRADRRRLRARRRGRARSRPRSRTTRRACTSSSSPTCCSTCRSPTTPSSTTCCPAPSSCVEAEFASGRLTAVPLEGRACLAEWERGGQRVVLHTSTQVPHLVRTTVAGVLGLDEHRVRVVAPDVGGGFGQKCVVAREEVLVCVAARAVGAPVKWVEDRVESLLAGFQGHEQRFNVRAGFDADGRMLAVDADIVCDVGAYSTHPFTCGVEPLMAATEMLGPYRVGALPLRAPARWPPTRRRWRPTAASRARRWCSRWSGCCRRRRCALELEVDEIRLRNLDPARRVPARQRRPASRSTRAPTTSRSSCARDTLDLPAFRERQRAAREEGRLLGHRLRLLRRAHGLRHRGVRAAQDGDHPRLRHRARAHGPVGLRAAVGRHLRPRPGPPDDARAGRRRPARPRRPTAIEVRQGDTDATPVRLGHVREPLDGGGRRRHAARRGPARRPPQDARRAPARGRPARTSSCATAQAVVRGAPGQERRVRRTSRALAYLETHRLPEGVEPGLECTGELRPARHVLQRLPRRDRRDRPRDRRACASSATSSSRTAA